MSIAASIRPLLSSRIGFVLVQMLVWVLLQTGLRVFLVFKFGGEAVSGSFGEWAKVFLLGVHRDAAVASVLFLPFWLVVAFLSEGWFRRGWFRALVLTANGLAWCGLLFLWIADYYFFEEFRSRFNTVAIDYLLYPHEVFTNVWESYPVPAVLAFCGGGAFAVVWGARAVAKLWAEMPLGSRIRRQSLLVALGAALLLVLPVSLGEIRFSRERLRNEIANNALLSGINAAWSRNLDYAAFYATLPHDQALARARAIVTEPGSVFDFTNQPMARRIAGDPTRPRKNLVILLEESLGSEFWGCLGRPGESMMPEMDRLATSEGWLFENLYATGNRTVRGFEGVLSSFVPLPGDSIVRRDRSENVESIARVMRRDGYRTLFLYGGRGLFDGMRAYSVNNGYERFIEQKDFPKPSFTTIWGVANEDLYQRTLEELKVLHKAGEPFFVTALSVSNHKPFTYPKGRIAEDPEARKREYAVKYTDWALARFFESAKREPFWKDTIFVVVADHGARVYGSQSIPIHSYEIPMVLLGPTVVTNGPRRIATLGCQLDIAPTLLGLIGRPYNSMFFGKDLFKGEESSRLVILNHNRSIGAYRDERLVVLGLNKTVEFYHGNPKKGKVVRAERPDPQDEELRQDAVSLFQVADELYMNRRFALDLPEFQKPPAAKDAARP